MWLWMFPYDQTFQLERQLSWEFRRMMRPVECVWNWRKDTEIQRKDVIDVLVNTLLTVTHTHTHTGHTLWCEWHLSGLSGINWNPISFWASAQLLAVTEDSRHQAVAFTYVTLLESGLLSLGAMVSVSNSPAGGAHHTSRPPLSNKLEWSHWVIAPAVTESYTCVSTGNGSTFKVLSLQPLSKKSIRLKIAQFSV